MRINRGGARRLRERIAHALARTGAREALGAGLDLDYLRGLLGYWAYGFP